MSSAIAAYVPVLHAGYIELFDRHQNAKTILVIGDTYVRQLSGLHTEIRALPAKLAAAAVTAATPGLRTEVITPRNREKLLLVHDKFIVPSDHISQAFAAKYLKNKKRVNDSAFLRWDEASVYSQSDVHYDRVSNKVVDCKLIQDAATTAQYSGDWWRQVGALLRWPDGTTVLAHNRHVPDEMSAYFDGDPRDVIPAGKNSELNTVLHAEQSIITEAARRGNSLAGADLYVTVFPCPMCAKQIAAAGIKRLFFASGHASLDGESVLKAAGVELIYVPTK